MPPKAESAHQPHRIPPRGTEGEGAVGGRPDFIGGEPGLGKRADQQRRHEQEKCYRHRPDQERRLQASAMNGYQGSRGGTKFSLTARALVQRIRLSRLPALSFVPLARPPPNGCCPTTAPVGLSLR